MACVHKFEKGLDFDCVKELIVEARSGAITAETVKKGLWLVGCGVEFFAPREVIGDDVELSTEELCDQLEAAMLVVQGDDTDPAKVDPLVWISLAKLVWDIVQKFMKK